MTLYARSHGGHVHHIVDDAGTATLCGRKARGMATFSSGFALGTHLATTCTPCRKAAAERKAHQ